jgi:ArsR family transcriptional regulator, arsenate/arsenite/antimonite-responsive transcriptional repressor
MKTKDDPAGVSERGDVSESRGPSAAGDATDARAMVDYVAFFKALGNPTRAQIIEFLLGGERCVCEMTGPLDQSQPLVSHHLALLRDAGLLRMRSEGTRTYYSIDWERFDDDLTGFLAHVEQLRNAPQRAADTSACATREASAKSRKAS